MKTILTVIGTRPEAIKMAVLISKLNKDINFCHKVCVTGQHKELLYQALDIFKIVPDIDLNIMVKNQTLSDISARILTSFTEVLKELKPDLILVHGDTTTSFICSLAAFYQQIPVAHVEAGLRTNNIYSPFPEEMNRLLTGKLASIHFAPTISNKNNLLKEGILEENIYITGNTVIDTLLSISDTLYDCPDELKYMENIIDNKFILITGHRRENFGEGFENICDAILQISIKYPDCHIIYPVHLNPNVKNIVTLKISGINNIHLIDPQSYISFIYLMKKCVLILTDSGGVQEEAPSLNKPVLVMREHTERTEALTEKTIRLVGTDADKIVKEVSSILDSAGYITIKANPYGDGKASDRIINHLYLRFL